MRLKELERKIAEIDAEIIQLAKRKDKLSLDVTAKTLAAELLDTHGVQLAHLLAKKIALWEQAEERRDFPLNDACDLAGVVMALMDSLHAIAGEEWPNTVTHDGATYTRTGKTGWNAKNGTRSAEYEHGGRRVWRLRTGEIVEE